MARGSSSSIFDSKRDILIVELCSCMWLVTLRVRLGAQTRIASLGGEVWIVCRHARARCLGAWPRCRAAAGGEDEGSACLQTGEGLPSSRPSHCPKQQHRRPPRLSAPVPLHVSVGLRQVRAFQGLSRRGTGSRNSTQTSQCVSPLHPFTTTSDVHTRGGAAWAANRWRSASCELPTLPAGSQRRADRPGSAQSA